MVGANLSKYKETDSIALLSERAVSDIANTIKNYDIITPEYQIFLQENKNFLGKVMAHTFIWRTDEQKRSIISDGFCPTLHSKFHQSLSEMKVQQDQAFYLAKDFELHKLALEEKLMDLEDLGDTTNQRREDLKAKKLQIEIQFMEYELQQMKIAMSYRFKEVKGWRAIQEELLKEMRSQNIPEEDIWDKDSGQAPAMFLQTLTNLQGIKSSTDGAERNNLVQLAVFSYNRIKESGRLGELVKQCNPLQLASLKIIEGLQ